MYFAISSFILRQSYDRRNNNNEEMQGGAENINIQYKVHRIYEIDGILIYLITIDRFYDCNLINRTKSITTVSEKNRQNICERERERERERVATFQWLPLNETILAQCACKRKVFASGINLLYESEGL